MDEQRINKTIGYGVVIIIAYNIVSAFIPLLTWGVVALVILRVLQEYQKHKK